MSKRRSISDRSRSSVIDQEPTLDYLDNSGIIPAHFHSIKLINEFHYRKIQSLLIGHSAHVIATKYRNGRSYQDFRVKYRYVTDVSLFPVAHEITRSDSSF
jgi:hypothetical protein